MGRNDYIIELVMSGKKESFVGGGSNKGFFLRRWKYL